MSFIFDYDQKTKKVNRMIRKFFGVECNCFFCYDTIADHYRLSFVETMNDKKHTPTQLINDSLNHLFFNNLNGPTINPVSSFEEIQSFCGTRLNMFKDRRNFLLELCNLFTSKFNMTETGAVSEANTWQECIYAAWKSENKNQINLYLSHARLENLSKKHVLYKMTRGLDIKKNPHGVQYKILELDMDALEATILMYS